MRVQTEMGGKNALLVLPDADLDLARTTILAAAFGQSGQRCTATSRLIVHRDVAPQLREELVTAVGALNVGRGDAQGTDVGPLVSQAQLEGALAAIERARAQGARVLVGGERLTDTPYDLGYFLSPTVVGEVTDRMELWRDEVFGPVLSMSIVDSFEEGIAAVNDTSYGLSASVFTADLHAAHRFAREADAGQVAVNLPTIGWDVHVPFGGFKDSGSAFKEHGVEGTRFYTRIKSVAMGFGSRPSG